jgi:hypothetical protein
MISIDARSVRAQVTAMQAVLRGRRDALAGAVRITITPTPDGRTEGTTNTAVLASLSQRFPGLVAVDADMTRLVRLGARLAFDPMTSTLRDIAAQAGPLVAATVARRLRSGQYVTNTAATLADKARRGAGQTPGVDSEQLARSLDRAVVRVE